ncbi:hypothetical protein C1632_03885 [Microbacterium testaceum]|nr:hypothetical protein C1632_03885 [Microbacterium testaceum]
MRRARRSTARSSSSPPRCATARSRSPPWSRGYPSPVARAHSPWWRRGPRSSPPRTRARTSPTAV